MNDRPVRLLVIGTLPPPVGGASVSLKHLVDYLQRRDDVVLTVVNTSGIRGHPLRAPFRFLSALRRIVRGLRRCDAASLHVAITAIPILGPVVWALARLWGRPLIVRKFGGEDFTMFGPLRRGISRFVARHCDLYLVQTQILLRAAQADRIPRVAWYPTSRPMGVNSASGGGSARACRRFVFLGQIKTRKGIGEAIAAAERFDSDVSLDVYGPFYDGLTEAMFAGLHRVRYLGVVPPGESPQVLRRYDALLLPTYWPGEGYPGIILEAYSAGLPVITTRWQAIPEIVDETSGILVEPHDAEGLYQAMKRLTDADDLYVRLRAGVVAKRASFDSQYWTSRFVEICRSLCAS